MTFNLTVPPNLASVLKSRLVVVFGSSCIESCTKGNMEVHPSLFKWKWKFQVLFISQFYINHLKQPKKVFSLDCHSIGYATRVSIIFTTEIINSWCKIHIISSCFFCSKYLLAIFIFQRFTFKKCSEQWCKEDWLNQAMYQDKI